MSKFSELDLDRQLLDAVSVAMQEPELSAEEQIERKFDWIVREMDELCAMANNPETVDLIEAHRVAIGQIHARASIIAGFLMARHPSKLRIVSNG